MKRFSYIFLVLVMIIFSSCINQKSDTTPDAITVAENISVTSETQDTLVAEIADTSYDGGFDNYSFGGIRIYEQRYYREYYYKEFFTKGDSVIALFKNDSEHIIIKTCKIADIEIGYDECAGCDLMRPIFDIKDDSSLFIIKGLRSFNKQPVKYTSIVDLPKPKQSFNINLLDKRYIFSGEGEVIEDESMSPADDERNWNNVKKYKLFLEYGNKKQLLTQVSGFLDTFPQILWLGDIDGDMKPDFILSMSSIYETNRILLFLSSFAEVDEIVKLVSITVDHFDC